MVAFNSSVSPGFAEALAAVGCQLQDRREAQSLSIQEISGRTKIQQRLLQAIEEGDLEELPEPVYIQQFVKRYAEALGLRGEDFSRVLPGLENPQPSLIQQQGSSTAPFRFIHLYLLYASLIMVAFAGLLYVNHRSAQLQHPPSTAGVK